MLSDAVALIVLGNRRKFIPQLSYVNIRTISKTLNAKALKPNMIVEDCGRPQVKKALNHNKFTSRAGCFQ